MPPSSSSIHSSTTPWPRSCTPRSPSFSTHSITNSACYLSTPSSWHAPQAFASARNRSRALATARRREMASAAPSLFSAPTTSSTARHRSVTARRAAAALCSPPAPHTASARPTNPPDNVAKPVDSIQTCAPPRVAAPPMARAAGTHPTQLTIDTIGNCLMNRTGRPSIVTRSTTAATQNTRRAAIAPFLDASGGADATAAAPPDMSATHTTTWCLAVPLERIAPHHIQFAPPVTNMVIPNGWFRRIQHTLAATTLQGIHALITIQHARVQPFYNKIKVTFADALHLPHNQSICTRIDQLEDQLLQAYVSTAGAAVAHKIQHRHLRAQTRVGAIKLTLPSTAAAKSAAASAAIGSRTHRHGGPTQPPLVLVLKISGLWETPEAIGLTFQFTRPLASICSSIFAP